MHLLNWLRPRRSSGDPGRFGVAVAGTGHGAEKMCSALRGSPHVRVSAMISSSRERAARFGQRYRVERAYTYDNFDQIAHDESVAAVYLALPVGVHREFTERAAAAGKHVLCEKPMASTAEDARAMIAACAAAHRLLMVAYRLDYDPMHAEAARLLREGVLGEITRVQSAFGIVAKSGWRFDPRLAGGGSLFDVGVYPIHALQTFFGEHEITAATLKRDKATGLEVDARWSGSLPSGAPFTCHSSYVERDPDVLRIEGSHGFLQLEHAFAYERTRLRARWQEQGRERTFEKTDSRSNPSLFRLEAEHLAHCVQTGEPLRSPGESGLRDLETIARIEALGRQSAG